uniref:Uncharacterized protein n=1 Tax=Caenorhabditis japonica TaxID=281687 RepID=A0A8R1ER81_CAEJA
MSEDHLFPSLDGLSVRSCVFTICDHLWSDGLATLPRFLLPFILHKPLRVKKRQYFRHCLRIVSYTPRRACLATQVHTVVVVVVVHSSRTRFSLQDASDCTLHVWAEQSRSSCFRRRLSFSFLLLFGILRIHNETRVC